MSSIQNSAGPLVSQVAARMPRVSVIGLASCYGCQLQITNIEKYLMDILGQIDLKYWQLISSIPKPYDFDVVVIEGAITTQESLESVLELRRGAKKVIAIGACANTAGVCGIAAKDFTQRAVDVYDTLPAAAGTAIVPRSIHEVIEVDYQVPCCPIDPFEFLETLGKALYGSNRRLTTRTMCGDCKRNETKCFYTRGTLCLGMVTRAGCNARCVNLNRPCSGCRGLSPEANLDSAREAVTRHGLSIEAFDAALEVFNQTNPLISGKE
ncbi:MAG: NADH:ubiquinone oxidoreductase [Eggerthellaceae bacterium]|nr:NADH:ubiquinone oxidoreductase [Eggerthellaceae bacterium]